MVDYASVSLYASVYDFQCNLLTIIYSCVDRAQKSLGLVSGAPDYAPVSGFQSPDVAARTYAYSADGRLYAYALPTV